MKKLSLILTALFAVTVLSAQTVQTVIVPRPMEATAVKGDIDLDGDVDSDDLTLLARHVGGIEVITDSAVLANADVNGDDEVDSDDLTKHARYVGGIITDWSQE